MPQSEYPYLLVPDTNVFAIFDEPLGEKCLIDILIEVFDVYLPPRVEAELRTAFPELYDKTWFWRNTGFLKEVWQYYPLLRHCRRYVTRQHFMARTLGAGELDAIAVSLLLSRIKQKRIIFLTQDQEAVEKSRSFFVSQCVGEAWSCDQLINYLRLQMRRKGIVQNLFQSFGVSPLTESFVFEPVLDRISCFAEMEEQCVLSQFCHSQIKFCGGECFAQT